MKILTVGGGPGGLHLAILLKKARPEAQVEVIERNAPDATFGFGVVFSDETLGYLQENDEPTFKEITNTFNRWDAIEIRDRDQVRLSRGHGFSGIARERLLEILQRPLPVARRGVPLPDRVRAARGARPCPPARPHRRRRQRQQPHPRALRGRFRPAPQIDLRRNKYAWFGTSLPFKNFLFSFRPTEHGGSVEARMQYPLEVFDAVRAVWPEEKPMSVRISATDADGPTFAHAMTKRMLHQAWDMPVDEAIEAEAHAQAMCMQTNDFRRAYEGFSATPRRGPVFQGD